MEFFSNKLIAPTSELNQTTSYRRQSHSPSPFTCFGSMVNDNQASSSQTSKSTINNNNGSISDQLHELRRAREKLETTRRVTSSGETELHHR
ncbi:hypothetical protein KY285_003461 [Solanum tuberosum]|nr:hypothetical protein KY289_003802 [Solanum tuberosum]KAH0767590.1 hypothetical protein KY285_003461 [Solanum tuberosum]